MNATVTTGMAVQCGRNAANQWKKALLLTMLWAAILFFFLPELAHATGTGTSTGAGGAGAAQARIISVANGWQNIVQGVGVAVLVMAWSTIGYMIAFNGKTAKDLYPTMLGSTIAGLSPILVGWLFS